MVLITLIQLIHIIMVRAKLVIADALKDGYRDKVFIADKLPSWLIQKREDMDHYLQGTA